MAKTAALDVNPRAAIGGNNPPEMLEVPNAETLKRDNAPIFSRLAAWKKKADKAERDGLKPVTLEDCAKLKVLYREGVDIANDAEGVRTKVKAPFLAATNTIDGLFNVEIRDKVGAVKNKGGLAERILQAAADRELAIGNEERARAKAAADALAAEAARLEEQAQKLDDSGKAKQADTAFAKADAAASQANELAAVAAAPTIVRGTAAGGVSSTVRGKMTCTGVVRDELDLEKLRPYFDQEALVKAVQKGIDMGAFRDAEGRIILKGAAVREVAHASVRRGR